MSWRDQLQTASWRGVPFAVLASRTMAGRKTAEHGYPFRDTVWVEDLGKKGRRYSFQGYIVGEDVYAQEQSMLAATEQPNQGVLVHPSLGPRTVSLTEFSSGITFDQGRVVTLEFTFVEGGSPLYPGANTSTQDQVDDDADDAANPVGSDYKAQVQSTGPVAAPVTVTNPDGTKVTYQGSFTTPSIETVRS
jgi:prophage DNA circulation protein